MSLSQGTVSAIRPNYKFFKTRQATVIQTDGALNPGNSGGPKASAGINFAVAVSDVRSFLTNKSSKPATVAKAPAPKSQAKKASCKPKQLKEWKEKQVKYTLYDFYCKGKGNALLAIPNDKKKNPSMALDRNGDEKADAIIVLNREGKPQASKWDDDFDGEFDYRGEHKNGDWEPSRRVRI